MNTRFRYDIRSHEMHCWGGQMWWQKQDRAFDAGAQVAKDRTLNIDPSICNR